MTAGSLPETPGAATADAPAGAARRGWLPAPVPVLGAIASVQIGSALAKDLFGRAGPAGTVLLRLVLSALIVVGVARPAPWRWPRRTLALVAVFGLVLAAMNLSFYEAISRIPLGPAVTIEFLGPLAVAVAGSRRVVDVLWAALAAGGVVLLTSDAGQVTLVGGGFALLAASCWGCYILLSQRVGAVVPGIQGLAVALVVGAVVLAPIVLPTQAHRLGSFPVLAGGLGVAVLSSALPYSLELVALRRLSTRVFGVLMSLEPAVAALAGWVVLGEGLMPREYVAIVLVSAASAGATLAARRDPPERLDG